MIKWSAVVAAWLIGLVFIYAGLTKIVAGPELAFGPGGPHLKLPEDGVHFISAQEFAKAIHNYKMLPPVLERLLAVVLPWIEIAAGVALFTRRFRYEGGLVLCGTTVMFIIAVSQALVRKLDIQHCGCFTISSGARSFGMNVLIMDVAMLLVIAGILAWLERERRSRATRDGDQAIRPPEAGIANSR